MEKAKQLSGWQSGQTKVRRSTSHTDMYILSTNGIGFWNLHATQDYMLAKYPINKKIKAKGQIAIGNQKVA